MCLHHCFLAALLSLPSSSSLPSLIPPSFFLLFLPPLPPSPLPRVTVEEGVGVLEVVVEREQGVVGAVSVVYLVTDVGATNGEDFSVDSLNVRRRGRETGRVGGEGGK